MARSTTSAQKSRSLVRPIIRELQAYTPGEQPKIEGLVKLNTNENPYPPAPAVLNAVKNAVDGRLRLYPNPTAEPLRQRLAELHKCSPENLVVGNGSDELLALASRAFVEPLTGLTHYALEKASAGERQGGTGTSAAPGESELGEALSRSRYTVQYFQPSYSLYPVLAAMHGARPKAIPLNPDFSLPSVEESRLRNWDFDAALSYVTTPNAPSGRGYTRAELMALCTAQTGVIVLDEAYVDFAREHALDLALELPNVLVMRTFSKAYSLCFLRVGYAVGNPALIEALQKIRDSYNVNGLGQVAALATLDSLDYYRENFKRIIRTRDELSRRLAELGFEVFPSQANFILVKPPRHSAEQWLQDLREERILVRWFSSPEVRDYLRITIGSEAESEALLEAVQRLLAKGG